MSTHNIFFRGVNTPSGLIWSGVMILTKLSNIGRTSFKNVMHVLDPNYINIKDISGINSSVINIKRQQ